ncbi:MAG: hypothetical protein ACLUCI_03325 [Blautia hansenii]|nr:hypothetical protein [Blautia sp.]
MRFWYILMTISFVLMLLFMSGVDGPEWELNLFLAVVFLGVTYFCQKKLDITK